MIDLMKKFLNKKKYTSFEFFQIFSKSSNFPFFSKHFPNLNSFQMSNDLKKN